MSEEGGDFEDVLWEAPTWPFSSSPGNPPGGQRPPPESRTDSLADGRASAAGSKRGRLRKYKSGSRGSGCNKGGSGAGVTGESDHEIHIWTERERRKKMRNMFSNLHALLPHLPAKADKSTIVDEAINYIRNLQLTLQKLQKQKLERTRVAILLDEPHLAPLAAQPAHAPAPAPLREALLMADQAKNWQAINPSSMHLPVPLFPQCFQTWTSPNIVLSVAGADAHINICTVKKPGLASAIAYVLEKHRLDIISAHVSSDCLRSMFMIHAQSGGGWGDDQYPETSLPAEEIFKLATGEIMLWTA